MKNNTSYKSASFVSLKCPCIFSKDLPEFFEDNMETWMTNFHGLLTLDNKLLQTDVSFENFNSFITFLTLFVPRKLKYLCVLWLLHMTYFRMRRKQVYWSCWNLRSVTTLLFMLRSMMKNFSRICHVLSQPSGTFWFPLARKSSMTWWVSLYLSVFCGSSLLYQQYTLSLFQLVSNAIQFLASVCERPHYKHLFEDQNTLTSICEKVIVPNMEFRSESVF